MGVQAVVHRAFFPGLAPYLQTKVTGLPLPKNVIHFLNHPAGPFTIHFWAPAFKWGISLANIADLKRPADKVSLEQQLAVTATGLIWSRYSMVVRPKNWNLFSVNVFMAGTGLYQLWRVYSFKRQAA